MAKQETHETKELTIQKLNSSVLSVIGSKNLMLFDKAFRVAEAIGELKLLLTPEYMKPIMALQGNKLGFRTDKDKTGGYSEDVVKNCLIEATLMGLQVTGNQFNIIAGNTYPTKEGMGYLLANFEGLEYTLTTAFPRINESKTSAAVGVKIKWKLNGVSTEESFEIPIKLDAYTSVDAMLGKATRKGRAWLYSKISGTEITDGEVEDATHTVVSSKVNKRKEEIENERMDKMIADCTDLTSLELLQNANPDFDASLFDAKKAELINKQS